MIKLKILTLNGKHPYKRMKEGQRQRVEDVFEGGGRGHEPRDAGGSGNCKGREPILP